MRNEWSEKINFNIAPPETFMKGEQKYASITLIFFSFITKYINLFFSFDYD